MSETKPAGIQLVDVTRMEAERAVERLIEHAISLRASDLFFSPNEQHLGVQVRTLGIVQPISIVPHDLGRRMTSHIKASAGMDVSEKRRPGDGRWIYDNGEEQADLRISVVPTMYGEDVALRLLDRSNKLFVIENLGMTPQQQGQVISMIDSPSGLILCTGPTGSGKTATLYASLIRLNDGKHKINTIEDPVEFAVDGLRQSQVNPQIDLTFAELLRGVLRQAPDVIMIGEVRDVETAQIAVRAANSGILVLATIHAPTAAGAIQSMKALDVHPHFLSTSLRGVIAQRLVRTVCKKCRVAFDLSDAPQTFDDVREHLGPDEGKQLYAPKGCEACGMMGYDGRTGVFEVMPVSRSIRNMIAENRPVRDVRNRAIEEGMLEFRQSALLKVARGDTSTEEVFRVIPSEHLLLDD
jgi:type II secretory ATPase GspE/PulE/Tfp pilus assembly ATPase PilB-like protein